MELILLTHHSSLAAGGHPVKSVKDDSGHTEQHSFHSGISMVASSMSAPNHKLILKPQLECLSMTNT